MKLIEVEQIFTDCDSDNYFRRMNAIEHTNWMDVAYALKAERDALVKVAEEQLYYEDWEDGEYTGRCCRKMVYSVTDEWLTEAIQKEIEGGE